MRPPAWFTAAQRRLLIGLVLVLNLFALSLSPFALVLVLVLAQFAWFVRTVNGGSRLAPFPVSRNRVFLFATLPGLLVGVATVAGLVAYLPDLAWAQVFSSRQMALGFALYAFAWWFVLSLLLDTMATPLSNRTNGRLGFLRAKHFLATALTIALAAIAAIERTRLGEALYVWEISRGRSSLRILADIVPGSTALLWGLAALCGVVAFVTLRRGLSRAELVPATDF